MWFSSDKVSKRVFGGYQLLVLKDQRELRQDNNTGLTKEHGEVKESFTPDSG